MNLRASLFIAVPLALVLFVAIPSFVSAQTLVASKNNVEAQLEVRLVAKSLDEWVTRVSLLPLGIAARQKFIGRNLDLDTVAYLASLLAEIPKEDVYGIYLAFEHKKWSQPNSMPWVDRRTWPKTQIVNYDYHNPKHDWYNGPKVSGKLHITEPYYDEGGSAITMVSVTRPMNDTKGRFIGVAGADLSLEDINVKLKSSIGDFYLVSRAGKVIFHPDNNLMPRKGYDGEDIKNIPVGSEIMKTPTGELITTENGSSKTIIWNTVPLPGWRLVLVKR